MPLEVVRLLCEVPARPRLLFEALGVLTHQDDALLDQSQAGPDRRLDGAPLLERERLRGVLVADPAAEGDDVRFILTPDRPAAFRAGQSGRIARVRILVGLLGDFLLVIHRGHSSFEVFILDVVVRQFNDPLRELLRRADPVGKSVGDRALRHAAVQGALRILNEAHAAVRLDRPHAERAVVERPGENDADRPRANRVRCRAEERVDRRSVSVLLGPAERLRGAVGDLDVAVGRRDENAAAGDLDTVADVLRR